MPFVYRVENEEMMGPYVTDYSNRCRGIPSYGMDHQPAPTWDGIGYVEPSQKFGFKSIEQLIDWFDLAFDDLIQYGFRVVQIRMPESRIKHGRRQLAFEEFVRPSTRAARRTIVPWEHVKELAGVEK